MHVDPFNSDTFLWLLEKMDVPYIPQEWNVLRDKDFAKDPNKDNGMAIFGKYLSKMKLKQWKRKRIRVLALIKLGVRARTAWRCVYDGKKSLWQLSHAPIVDRALNNARFALLGLKSLKRMWEEHHSQITVPC